MKKASNCLVVAALLFFQALSSETIAADEYECAIWLCSPIFFSHSSCAKPYQKMLERLASFKSSHPNFSSCLTNPSAQNAERQIMRSTDYFVRKSGNGWERSETCSTSDLQSGECYRATEVYENNQQQGSTFVFNEYLNQRSQTESSDFYVERSGNDWIKVDRCSESSIAEGFCYQGTDTALTHYNNSNFGENDSEYTLYNPNSDSQLRTKYSIDEAQQVIQNVQPLISKDRSLYNQNIGDQLNSTYSDREIRQLMSEVGQSLNILD